MLIEPGRDFEEVRYRVGSHHRKEGTGKKQRCILLVSGGQLKTYEGGGTTTLTFEQRSVTRLS